MEMHEPNVYPIILGGVLRGFWSPFLDLSAQSACLLTMHDWTSIWFRRDGMNSPSLCTKLSWSHDVLGSHNEEPCAMICILNGKIWLQDQICYGFDKPWPFFPFYWNSFQISFKGHTCVTLVNFELYFSMKPFGSKNRSVPAVTYLCDSGHLWNTFPNETIWFQEQICARCDNHFQLW